MKTNNKLILKLEDLGEVTPLTTAQRLLFYSWDEYPIHVLHGSAGTGKSFISVYKALEQVLDMKSEYKRLVLLRSVVPAREIGHLPGDVDEKSAVYELPYEDMCHLLFNRRDAYQRLKEQYKIQFGITSFLRGITFDNSIVIVDEIQNMNYMELYTVMTRIGVNSKIVFCGDFKQTDLKNSGLLKFLNVLREMESTSFHEFKVNDIVRSDLVKEFILAEEALNDRV